jgi:outer membrane protein OmpA-like peptidoglycan-associated protein
MSHSDFREKTMKLLSSARRAVTVAGVMVLVTGLAACGSAPKESATTKASTENAPEPTAVVPAEQVLPAVSSSSMNEISKRLTGAGIDYVITPEGLLSMTIPADTAFGKVGTNIRPPFAKVLNVIAENLVNFPKARIEIVVHTDNTRSNAVGIPLSLKRAESVRNHLVDRKVPTSHISTLGRGSDQPISHNANAQGQAKNRRIEVLLSER